MPFLKGLIDISLEPETQGRGITFKVRLAVSKYPHLAP